MRTMTPTESGPSGARDVRTTVFSPLYRQIKDLLIGSLEQGEWKPGESIPSEVELAARFQVSQGTVRKAIDELAAENLLVRRQGKGTFVATHHEARAQYRFLRIVPDRGEAAPATSRFVECRRVRAPAEAARALGLRTGDPTIFLRRLLDFDGRPVVLDDIWLPGSLFKGLSAERVANYSGPLYGLFETEFGIRMIRADERIRAIAADVDAGNLLEVATGTPLLLVDRVSYTYGERPVEVRRGRSVTTAHHYHNTLS
jgi:GntR family transcriptional regulator